MGVETVYIYLLFFIDNLTKYSFFGVPHQKYFIKKTGEDSYYCHYSVFDFRIPTSSFSWIIKDYCPPSAPISSPSQLKMVGDEIDAVYWMWAIKKVSNTSSQKTVFLG